MAIQNNALFASTSRAAPLRFNPRLIVPKKFAAVGAAPIYAPGTPVVFDTSTSNWKVWTNGGANGTGTIRGFVWPDPIQTHATLEVIGGVFFRGKVHAADVVLPGGETQNNLNTALALPGNRAQGLDIEGLPGIS